jgi:hypothetical protein
VSRDEGPCGRKGIQILVFFMRLDVMLPLLRLQLLGLQFAFN